MLVLGSCQASAEESLRRQLSFKREMEGFEKRLRAQLQQNSLLLKQGIVNSVDFSFPPKFAKIYMFLVMFLPFLQCYIGGFAYMEKKGEAG